MNPEAEQIRRSFALAWGRIGAAWGVAPSTASVQGYLLLHGGPLTEAEVRAALGMSHRAALLALAECAAWGLIERAPKPKRSGRRGPPASAWVPVDDHWEWFRRVAATRRERETDPVVPLIDECRRLASEAARARPYEEELGELERRLSGLTAFVSAFDAGVGAVVRTDAEALAHLFSVLDTLEERTVDRLLEILASIPREDLVSAAEAISLLPPALARRLVRLTGQRRPGHLLAGRRGS